MIEQALEVIAKELSGTFAAVPPLVAATRLLAALVLGFKHEKQLAVNHLAFWSRETLKFWPMLLSINSETTLGG